MVDVGVFESEVAILKFRNLACKSHAMPHELI